MLSKRAAIVFFSTIIVSIIIFFVALFIYDPLSVFHLPFSREFTLTDNMRKQNIALIRNAKFDSIIIGNSYTENTSSKEAGDVFGGEFVNLSMSGSILYEQFVVLDYVLRHSTIKTVFGILPENAARTANGSYPLSEWAFLYDENRFNDIKVYLNQRYLKCLAQWSEAPECVGRPGVMDRPGAWFEAPVFAPLFGGLDNWISHHKNERVKDTLHVTLPQNSEKPLAPLDDGISDGLASEIRDAIDTFIVRVAKKYPHTNFVYFFNPHMLLERAFSARDNMLNIHAFWVKETVLRCAALDNVRLYLFDNEPFTEDIQYYMDLGHYSPDINSLILQSIRLGKNRLTPDTVDSQLSLLTKRAAAYDLKAINAYVQEGIRRTDAGVAPEKDK